MERPTAALVRQVLAKVKWAKVGYPAPVDPPTEAAPDPLQWWVDMAADYVEEVTGREFATMPTRLEKLAVLAVALLSVANITGTTQDAFEAMAGAEGLASFSAGSYSETYRDPQGSVKAERESLMVHPWPAINRLLWLLMTPEKMQYWRGVLSGEGVPAYGVVEVDWAASGYPDNLIPLGGIWPHDPPFTE